MSFWGEMLYPPRLDCKQNTRFLATCSPWGEGKDARDAKDQRERMAPFGLGSLVSLASFPSPPTTLPQRARGERRAGRFLIRKLRGTPPRIEPPSENGIMKRLLAVFLLFTLVGCGGGPPKGGATFR